METYELHELLDEQRASDRAYHEFLRVSAFNAGIYALRAGEPDLQKPHEQDEIYYIISGTASFACDGHNDRGVTRGAVIYVEKGVSHHFHSITEDLTLLVLFAG